jgi:OOP family OmpA-OmpF porin
MTSSSSLSRLACLRAARPLGIVAMVACWPAGARAADAANGRRFGPTAVLSPYLTLDGTHTVGDGAAGVHVLGSYERRPLIFERDGERTIDIITERWATDLALTYGFLPRLDFGVNVPLIVSQSGRGPTGTGLASGALGDPALALKFELVDKTFNVVGVALVGQASLPLGNAEALAGEPASTMGGRLVLELPRGSRSDLTLNLGYRARQNTNLEDLVLDDELTAGFGVTQRLGTHVQAMAEASLATPAGAPFDGLARTPADANVGFRIRIYDGLHLSLGGGAGLLPGYGAPAWRAFVGFEAAPRRHDYDGDQVADGVDACPEQAGLIAEDGCPAREIIAKPKPIGPRKPADDLDEDLVRDEVDLCPYIAEDLDRFQDGDGCPEPDNDLDMLTDAYDGDPMGPEDWDGFEDDDGIPDTDNDRDGVADLEDKCPNEAAETETGCPGGPAVASRRGVSGSAGAPAPDAGGPLLLGDTLHPPQPIVFEFAQTAVVPSSEPHLDALARYLQAHSELGLFEVGVHVDSIGARGWKVWLSQARAEALVAALVARGVPADRLVAHGYGFDVPVADNRRPEGRFLNRRVELRRIDQSAENATRARGRRAPVPSPEADRGPVLRPETPIRFESRGAALLESSWPQVQAIARQIREHPEWPRIEVGVYTDGRGDHAFKWRLSQQRADTVRRALVAAGVEERRVVARGFGAMVPVADDATPEGRALNRRVEFTVLRPARPTHKKPHDGHPAGADDGDGPLSRSEAPHDAHGEDEE